MDDIRPFIYKERINREEIIKTAVGAALDWRKSDAPPDDDIFEKAFAQACKDHPERFKWAMPDAQPDDQPTKDWIEQWIAGNSTTPEQADEFRRKLYKKYGVTDD